MGFKEIRFSLAFLMGGALVTITPVPEPATPWVGWGTEKSYKKNLVGLIYTSTPPCRGDFFIFGLWMLLYLP